MKKIVLLILICIYSYIFITPHVLAYPNEPNGFRGIPWGTPKNQIPNLINCIPHEIETSCSRLNDKMIIGGANLRLVRYFFYKDLFSSVGIKTHKYSDSKALLEATQTNYGMGDQDNPYIPKYVWRGSNTLIIFDLNEIDGSAYLFMYSRAIDALQRQDEQNAARNSGKDF